MTGVRVRAGFATAGGGGVSIGGDGRRISGRSRNHKIGCRRRRRRRRCPRRRRRSRWHRPASRRHRTHPPSFRPVAISGSKPTIPPPLRPRPRLCARVRGGGAALRLSWRVLRRVCPRLGRSSSPPDRIYSGAPRFGPASPPPGPPSRGGRRAQSGAWRRGGVDVETHHRRRRRRRRGRLLQELVEDHDRRVRVGHHGHGQEGEDDLDRLHGYRSAGRWWSGSSPVGWGA